MSDKENMDVMLGDYSRNELVKKRSGPWVGQTQAGHDSKQRKF